MLHCSVHANAHIVLAAAYSVPVPRMLQLLYKLLMLCMLLPLWCTAFGWFQLFCALFLFCYPALFGCAAQWWAVAVCICKQFLQLLPQAPPKFCSPCTLNVHTPHTCIGRKHIFWCVIHHICHICDCTVWWFSSETVCSFCLLFSCRYKLWTSAFLCLTFFYFCFCVCFFFLWSVWLYVFRLVLFFFLFFLFGFLVVTL